jgi:hypothetical protein
MIQTQLSHDRFQQHDGTDESIPAVLYVQFTKYSGEDRKTSHVFAIDIIYIIIKPMVVAGKRQSTPWPRSRPK